MRIIRAWEGQQPPFVQWTEQAVRSMHPRHWVLTNDLDPTLKGSTPARRSNGYRFRKLYDQGGLWLDTDVIPLADLTSLRDEPWTAYFAGKYRPGIMYFPEPGHPVLAEALSRFEHDPDVIGAEHLSEAAKGSGLYREARVLPHTKTGRYILPEGETPLAVHLWVSSGGNRP